MNSNRSHNRMRLISNYIRLLATFLSGLLIIRLLAEIGASSLSIYLIVVSGTGFAFFMKIVMQESIVPLLGLSFDERENRSFAHTYWISFLFALAASLFAVTIFSIIWLLRESFDTGKLPLETFAVALVTGAMRTVVSALVTPPLHAVLVTGRVIAYNIFLAAERLVDVIAVILVLWLLNDQNEAFMASSFFLASAVLYIFVQVGAFIYAVRLDQRFRVRPVKIRPQDLSWTRTVFGWNIAVVVAFLLYLRFSTMAMNMAYGEVATLILGLVFMLIGYQRQISMGLVIGLDAMVARTFGGKSNSLDRDQKIVSMTLQTTYIQSIFSFASVSVLWVFAEPVFQHWLGDTLQGSGWDPAAAAMLFRIMSVGVLARSLSESWMKILNGHGFVGRYAPWLLGGGIIFSLTLVWMISAQVTLEAVLIVIAVIFSVLYLAVHLIIIPEIVCRSLAMSRRSLITKTLLPGLVIVPGTSILYSVFSPGIGAIYAIASSLCLLGLFAFRRG